MEIYIAVWRAVPADNTLRTLLRFPHPQGPSTMSAVQITVCRAVWDTNLSPLRGDSACWALGGAAALGSLFEGAGTRIGSSQPILVTEGVSYPFLGHSPSQKSNRFLTAPSGRGPRLPSTTYIAKLQFTDLYTQSGSYRPVEGPKGWTTIACVRNALAVGPPRQTTI